MAYEFQQCVGPLTYVPLVAPMPPGNCVPVLQQEGGAPTKNCAVVKWGMYRAATNVNDARKALKTQACPGIGHVRVAPPLL